MHWGILFSSFIKERFYNFIGSIASLFQRLKKNTVRSFYLMKNKQRTLFFLFLFCSAMAQQQHSISLLSYDFTKGRQITLPEQLREISGLATSSDGKVFGHNDETGDIFQINISDGTIMKTFSLGPQNVLEDFEGIAIAGKTFYLVNSSGLLYEFAEGKNGERVPYKTYSTPLSEEYNVEGLCYDPNTNALLLACKGFSGFSNSGFKAIFSFSLSSKKLTPSARFLISIKEMKQRLGKHPFRPSAMECNSSTGTFFVLGSKNFSIIEISPDGKVINAIPLSSSLHRQPEGIAFAQDGSLLISDEGKKNGTVTIYKQKQ